MIDWIGRYSGGWQKEIVPEAFSHPAKFARGLIRRIYEHALEQGYLQIGNTCLDPFGGVGLGAADALANGLHFIGIELEQNFVDLGAGCDCTGIGKADWVACFGRWKRFAYKDGRHWCPRCLAEAERVIAPRPPTLPGMGLEPTASYERNSGKIPHTGPHRYAGNLDLFARHARDGATAVLVQGDSRQLVEVLEGARAEGIIASPPYSASQIVSGSKGRFANHTEHGDLLEQIGYTDGYGTDPAQLGNMPTGRPPQAVIGSPPHGIAGVGHDAGHPRLDATEDARREAEGCGRRPAYGESDGQLGAMREGDVDAVIASPPYATSEVIQSHGRSWRAELDEVEGSWRNVGSQYGDQDGQLAALPEGDAPAGIVSSPPWESNLCRDGRGIDLKIHKQLEEKYNRRYSGRSFPSDTYGEHPDQLGNQQGDTFWTAAKTILLQCHQVLAPGGVAIWVLKAFVRNKQIVDFPGQWRALCESCGFETVEVIRAWLVEDRGAQFALNGDLIERKVARKSFFRRLHEKKYPHLAIDYEVVLVTRKI